MYSSSNVLSALTTDQSWLTYNNRKVTIDIMGVWFVNSSLQEGKHLKLIQDGDRYKLILREALPIDEGEYTCKAVNRGGEVSCSGQLVVSDLIKGR